MRRWPPRTHCPLTARSRKSRLVISASRPPPLSPEAEAPLELARRRKRFRGRREEEEAAAAAEEEGEEEGGGGRRRRAALRGGGAKEEEEEEAEEEEEGPPMALSLDRDAYYRRLRRLYGAWQVRGGEGVLKGF